MSDFDWKDYLDAVDTVCLYCGYPFDKTLEEWECDSCPVRRTVELIEAASDNCVIGG